MPTMPTMPATPTTTRPGRAVVRQRARRRLQLGGVFALAFAIAIATGVSLSTPQPGDSTQPVVATEVNAMGMPVVPTPGTTYGHARAGTIEVTGSSWDLGRVPLNVAVRPDWTLRNTGTTPVTLGQPHAEVREGCCPGPITLDTATLAAGESTTLTFELGMHPGMDGPHALLVHVPIHSTDGTDQLTLDVVGDFRA